MLILIYVIRKKLHNNGNNYTFFLATLVTNDEKRRDETKNFNECNRSVAVTRAIQQTAVFHRLVKFEFRSICSSFLFLAARSRNKVKRAGLTRTITPW